MTDAGSRRRARLAWGHLVDETYDPAGASTWRPTRAEPATIDSDDDPEGGLASVTDVAGDTSSIGYDERASATEMTDRRANDWRVHLRYLRRARDGGRSPAKAAGLAYDLDGGLARGHGHARRSSRNGRRYFFFATTRIKSLNRARRTGLDTCYLQSPVGQRAAMTDDEDGTTAWTPVLPRRGRRVDPNPVKAVPSPSRDGSDRRRPIFGRLARGAWLTQPQWPRGYSYDAPAPL